jgi:hypothetical protein
MIGIPDDPVIRCMEATGLPPWQISPRYKSYGSGFGCGHDEWEEEDDFEGDGDVYYGNETDSF